MKSHTYWASALLVLALALWCTLGVSAEDTTTTASGTAGSFQLEQVYVNAPELDVYFYATDANGESYSPIVVQAQGVEATLGDRKLDTGMIGVAEDPICYIIALDNSTSIDAEDFHKMRTAIWKLAQTKQDKDQIMVYTLAGGAQCALPATNDKAEIFNTLRTIGQSEGAIDLTGTVTMLAADIQTEYQSLAPRKVAFVCTDAAQVMTDLGTAGRHAGYRPEQLKHGNVHFHLHCRARPAGIHDPNVRRQGHRLPPRRPGRRNAGQADKVCPGFDPAHRGAGQPDRRAAGDIYPVGAQVGQRREKQHHRVHGL